MFAATCVHHQRPPSHTPHPHPCAYTHRRWKYMITGILEVDVKPRLQMWSWQHIRHHRQTVKHYRELYKTKITSKKPSEELLKELEVRRRGPGTVTGSVCQSDIMLL